MLQKTTVVSLFLTLFLLLLPLPDLHARGQMPSPLLPPDPDGAREEPLEQEAPATDEPAQEEEPLSEPEADAPAQPEPEPVPEREETALTLLLPDGTVAETELEEYLVGVLAAEMPASFEEDALRAQAVAARTYTLYQLAHPDTRHPEAQLCTDYACCQAWVSLQERQESWPEEQAQAYARKLCAAVEDTRGEYLLYSGAPALTVFHSSCDGQTCSAQEVWGQAVPYLVSVDSPEGEQDAPNYYSVLTLSAEDFAAALGTDAASLPEDCGAWVTPTPQGTWRIGEREYEGKTLRALFALRSASFTVEADNEARTLTFYVTGYGHGVGMSQYGANVLAGEGMGYREILEHYYPGTQMREGEPG